MANRYLEMKSIYKTFPGVKALQNVDFGVDEGEVVALVGENGAGKSTLMNVLGGLIKRDTGEIWIDGNKVNINAVSDAQAQRIAFIHQELSLFQQLTVMENLFVDSFSSVKAGIPCFISKRKMKQKTMEIFRDLDIEIPPTTKVRDLPMGKQQMVEIAAAVLKDAKIIILDEPTTSLANKERAKLNEIVTRLKKEKKLIIYITHELENAIEISDRVCVLRDGKNVGEGKSSELTKPDVVGMMIGSKAGKAFVKSKRDIKDNKVLEFKNVKTATKLQGVSLDLKRGEVLGLYGLIGSGRTELIRAMYGLDKITDGEIIYNGKKVEKFNPKVFKQKGVAYLTENRRDEGLFLELGINFNIVATDIDKFSKGFLGVMKKGMETEVTEDSVKKLSISTPSIYQLAGKLSGGNQQKVVIAKWLHLAPQVFILDEPTRGIDVGAKDEIYRLIDEIANQGVSIILISSEIEEILGMSDRVVVMSKGAVVGVLDGSDITNANIIKYTMS
jgi:ABC-type sugar transport system ATPase subunit